jgi:RNA polymerase sigma factor (sigma-70 family)
MIVSTMVTMTGTERSRPPDGIPGAPDPVTAAAAPTGRARWERAAVLFGRWRDGDTPAMDELVALMTPVLWHVARAYGLDRELAEDVVQTTWLKLVQRHTTIAGSQAVAAWLTTCARREAWRVSRQQRRSDPIEPEELEPHLPADRSAEQEVEAAATDRQLWDAMSQLAERCQRLLRVIAFDDRPDYARIARDLAMPVGSIGPTRQRCLAKLRSLLMDAGLEGAWQTT